MHRGRDNSVSSSDYSDSSYASSRSSSSSSSSSGNDHKLLEAIAAGVAVHHVHKKHKEHKLENSNLSSATFPATNYTTATNAYPVDVINTQPIQISEPVMNTHSTAPLTTGLATTGAGVGLLGLNAATHHHTTTATTGPSVTLVNDIANTEYPPEEALKGKGGKLRNKLRGLKHKHRRHRHGEEAVIAGTTAGIVGTEYVDRAKFNLQGPVDQLDQKLADRNLIDNAIAPSKGELYNVGGFPAVESFRQDPAGIMRHKFTGQTHFDSENATTGPGFTNGDLYDKPGFAGTKLAQDQDGGLHHHKGPIEALAHKIVGQKYTTHEPLMDKIYVEPHQKGPIDTLAHMIVGKKGSQLHPTETGATTGFVQEGLVKESKMDKLKDKLHLHRKHNVATTTTTGTSSLANKEKAEGPVDALIHKLTGTLHNPLHHKGGVGAQHAGVIGGANTIPITDNIADKAYNHNEFGTR